MAQRHDEQHEPTGLGSATLRIGAVAVVLVLAVVAARARAEGALPSVAGPSGGLVIGIIRSIGIAVVTAGLVLLVWGRRIRRQQVAAGGPPKKQQLTAAQRKRVTVAALVGILVALAYQVLLRTLNPTQQQQPPPAPDQPVGPPDASGLGFHNLQSHELQQAGLGTYLTVIGALVALAALIIVLLRRTVTVELEDEAEETPAEAVAKAVAAGQAAVQDRAITDPREAIVACFAAMERALAGLGGDIAPREADTPGEVLTRGVRGAKIPEGPAHALLELFREARFSEHPMHESDRDSADRALTEILASLSTGAERAR
ncbi:MAG TPA: DUF4129 domain-containing protein [Pseudonocardia sp.]|jgi:hypothetical protein|nr:DUF4129 domain-containing protein [Pseudonocardia sp.]